MKCWMMIAAVLLSASLVAADLIKAPVIEKMSTDGEKLRVAFDKGAVTSCTVFQEQVVRDDMRSNFPDGHYTPRHCWLLSGDEVSLDEDWDFIDRVTPPSKWLIHAEVQYERAGQETLTMVSNIVEVVR